MPIGPTCAPPAPTSRTTGRDSVPSAATMRIGKNSAACYNASFMPSLAIRRRELYAFSVHYSIVTSKWIATLARPTEIQNNPGEEKRTCIGYFFASEREARKFAKSYSPPKMMSDATHCMQCSTPFSSKCRNFNCRNCGVCICDKCSKRWGIRMIPKTYLVNASSLTVRVCTSCDWLSNAFCLALLQGKFDDALSIFETGNVNLRTSFADIHSEAMFPIHCAVMGGSLSLVRWLVETHGCPLSVKRDPKSGMMKSVQTSANRTLIDLAMTGKPKIDILSYLVRHDLSITDTKDPSLAPKTLQSLMRLGFTFPKGITSSTKEQRDPSYEMDPCDVSVSTTEDACVICYERQMDCVLTPCGHQMCCSDCARHLRACPICKLQCTVLRIYRQ